MPFWLPGPKTVPKEYIPSTVLGPYANEYSLMMKMTESQDQVWEIKDFVDSEYSSSFFASLAQYIEQGGPCIRDK